MKHILWLLALVPNMLLAQAPPKADTVVTIIKHTPSVVSCAPCAKKDSTIYALVKQNQALAEELKHQKQVPTPGPTGTSTLTKATAVTSFLALVGVVWLILKKNSNSNNKDTYGDDQMQLKP